MPESHDGSQRTEGGEDEGWLLPRGGGGQGEFGGGEDGMLGDEEEIPGHAAKQFLARAVQGAGEGVVDGGCAVVVAKVDDEVAEGLRGGRCLGGGGAGG